MQIASQGVESAYLDILEKNKTKNKQTNKKKKQKTKKKKKKKQQKCFQVSAAGI